MFDLNLCPFARSVVEEDSLKITVYDFSDFKKIIDAFLLELDLIQSANQSEISTTLMALPNSSKDFDEFLGFIDLMEELIHTADLKGVIQLATFHPKYQFKGEPADSVSHVTNRSPYPRVHFLREDMITRATDNFPNPEDISSINIRIIEQLGEEKIDQCMCGITEDFFW